MATLMSCSVTQLSPSSPYTPLPGTNADDSNEQSTALKSIKSLAPLLDRVLVQRVKMEAKTAGGIYLPESSVKELNEAKVLAVGPGGLDKDGKRVSCSVAPGDKVLIPQVSWDGVLFIFWVGDGNGGVGCEWIQRLVAVMIQGGLVLTRF